MNVAVRRRAMAEAEFLAWVEPLERRYEFDGTGPAAKPAETEAHGVIQANLVCALADRLKGTGYRAVAGGIFVRAHGSLRLPDALLVRWDIRPQNRVIDDPVAIFEVLSEETDYLDRFTKANEYEAIQSIRHYVMLDQTFRGCVVLTRDSLGWERHTAVNGEDLLLPRLGLAVPVAELYEGLVFPEIATEPNPT